MENNEFIVHIKALEAAIERSGDVIHPLIQISNFLVKTPFEDGTSLERTGVCEILSDLAASDLVGNKSLCAALMETISLIIGYRPPPMQSIFNEETIRRFEVQGTCDSVIWCLQKHMRHDEAVAACCRAIRSLTYGNANIRKQFFDKGVCETVIGVLISCEEDDIICESACWAVMSLAFDDDIATALGNLGACELLVTFLRRRVTTDVTDQMKCAACWAIRNMSASNEANIARLNERDVAGAVLALVRSERVQTAEDLTCGALAALGGLCFDDDLAAEFGSSGMCELIFPLIRRYIRQEAVGYLGSEVIRNLSACDNPQKNIAALVQAGAVEVLVETIANFPDRIDITVMATRALGNLATSEVHRPSILRVGALDVITTVINTKFKQSHSRANSHCTSSSKRTSITKDNSNFNFNDTTDHVVMSLADARRRSVLAMILGDLSPEEEEKTLQDMSDANAVLHHLLGVPSPLLPPQPRDSYRSDDSSLSYSSSRTSSRNSSIYSENGEDTAEHTAAAAEVMAAFKTPASSVKPIVANIAAPKEHPSVPNRTESARRQQLADDDDSTHHVAAAESETSKTNDDEEKRDNTSSLSKELRKNSLTVSESSSLVGNVPRGAANSNKLPLPLSGNGQEGVAAAATTITTRRLSIENSGGGRLYKPK
eukprot:gene8779-18154_t